MVRNSDYEKNEAIQIITIICKIAKQQGKPYTHRLLPDFLMPGCVIRLDKAFDAYKLTRHSHDIELACQTMLCIDERTARKHMDCIETTIRQANIKLAETIAQSPEAGDLPDITPESTPLIVLTSLLDALFRVRLRSGTATPVPSILSFIHQIRWHFFSNRPSATVTTKQQPP